MIIAFFGYKQSGKTSAAKHLARHGFRRCPFASKLKSMLSSLGLTDEEINGNLKEEPCELLGGKTPRWAMQSLGTEWGRDLIDDNLWVRAWQRNIRTFSGNIVVDDLRFLNEEKVLKEEGAVLVRVDRECIRPQGEVHASEAFIDKIQADIVLDSNCSLDELLVRTMSMYSRLHQGCSKPY